MTLLACCMFSLSPTSTGRPWWLISRSSSSLIFFGKSETKKLKIPQSVHVSVNQNLNKGKQEVEYKPHVNHLDIGSLGQVVGDIDKHGSQHQHCYEEQE